MLLRALLLGRGEGALLSMFCHFILVMFLFVQFDFPCVYFANIRPPYTHHPKAPVDWPTRDKKV